MKCRTSGFLQTTLLSFILCFVTASYPMHRVLISKLRDKNTTTQEFRHASNRLATILATYASEQIATNPIGITTPCGITEGAECADDIVLIPVMRSGNTLLTPFMQMFEDARVGFILLQRDEETALPDFYYAKLPTIQPNTRVIILEPMLATGGSINKALEIVTGYGIPADRIIVISVICAREGLDRIHEAYPDVKIIYAAEDTELNDQKFIVPGLGDFGDRYYGTV